MSPAHRPAWSRARVALARGCSRGSSRSPGVLGRGGVLALTGLLSLASGCRAPERAAPIPARDGWHVAVVHEGDSPWCSVAAGDIDPAAPGDEVVAIGAEGAIVYLARDGQGLVSERIEDWADGVTVELAAVALGDVDRVAPGAEVVVVGAALTERRAGAAGDDDADPALAEHDAAGGVAWLLVRSAEGFTRTELHRADAPLRAALVADLDPGFAGDEVALAGNAGEVVLLVRTADGFVPRSIASLPGAVRAMATTPAGLVVACEDGALVWLARPERSAGLADASAAVTPWRSMHTWRAAGALLSVAARAGDVLVSGVDGVLRHFQTAGVGPDIAFVRETRCLALEVPVGGVTCVDIDPREAAPEAAAVADDGTLHVVRLTPWPVADDVVPASAGLVNHRVRPELVAGDGAALAALAAGRFVHPELGARATGTLATVAPEASALVVGLVCAGQSGRILIVHAVSVDRAVSAVQGAP